MENETLTKISSEIYIAANRPVVKDVKNIKRSYYAVPALYFLIKLFIPYNLILFRTKFIMKGYCVQMNV